MDNIVTLSTYKELKEAIELHKEVHGLILDSMIRRQSLIDSGEDVPELPKELQEFESCFDFSAVLRHQLGVAHNKGAFDQFAAAVDQYYFKNPNSSDFEVEYLIDPEEDYVDDDDWMEEIFEATGHRFDFKAVMDHVVGKKQDYKAAEDFMWFMKEREKAQGSIGDGILDKAFEQFMTEEEVEELEWN